MSPRPLIWHLRRQRGLILSDVSDATAIDKATICKAERGLVRLSTDQLERLGRFYRRAPGDLLRPAETRTEVVLLDA